jgi:hypothetical protein
VTVGRVTAVGWPRHAALATRLAETADRAGRFPGIDDPPRERPIRLVLAPDRARFDSLTGGRLPPWTTGAAVPRAGLIVLLAEGAPDRVAQNLRHELAHLAVRWRVARPLPRWLDEGYAAFAAGEWSRLDALRVNVTIARGRRMTLDQVDRALRGDQGDAAAAYALATTAVLQLHRWGGDDGLRRLFDALARGGSLDAALRATYYLTEADFEERWQKDVASRYGWLAGATAAVLAWALLGLVVAALALLRRRRDAERRARLDEVPWGGPPDEPSA